MRCPNCGTDLPENASFCGECGTKIDKDALTATPADAKPKGWQNNPAVRIIAIVAGIVLIVVGVLRITSALSPKDGPQTQQQQQQQAPAKGEELTTEQAKSYVESHGYLIGRAFLDLDGANLVKALETNGFEFHDSNDIYRGWHNDDDSCAAFVSMGASEAKVGPSEVSKLDAGGGSQLVCYILMFDGYTNAEKALNEVGQFDVEKQSAPANEVAVAIATAPDGTRYFCLVVLDEDVCDLMLFNEAMLESGVIKDHGSTVDEAYASFANEALSAEDVEEIEKNAKDETAGNTANKDLPKAPATLTEECLDGHDHITLYALSELTGADVTQTLESLGYTYDSKRGGYTTSDNKALFGAVNKDLKELSADEIKTLPKGGGDTSIAFILQADGYDSLLNAFRGLNRCVTEDCMLYNEDNEDYIFAVVYGPSMKEYFVSATRETDDLEGSYLVGMFSNEALAAGTLDAFLNDGTNDTTKYGSSIDELWKNLTGGPVGDYVREHPLT